MLVTCRFTFQDFLSLKFQFVGFTILQYLDLCEVARELNLWSSTQGSSLLVMREGPISQKLRQADLTKWPLPCSSDTVEVISKPRTYPSKQSRIKG